MGSYVRMPTLGLTMKSGLIIRWLKKEGDSVAQGDKLVEIESDKSTFEYESESSGILQKCYYEEGSEIGCQRVIAFIGSPGEKSPPQPPDEETGGGHPVMEQGPAAIEGQLSHQPGGMRRSGRQPVSPRARRYARENCIDLSGLPGGSGSGGRIEERDVIAYQRAKPELLKVSRMRAAISRRLSESKASAPHYYLSLSITMELVQEERARARERIRGKGPSLNAVLIKAASTSLERHPAVHSSWSGENILRHHRADIALAVATPNGLLTPVVHDCYGKSVEQIDAELQMLFDAAKRSDLKPQDYEGATFTISNLGPYDIESFTAIINPPASAILAVGKIMERPVVVEHTIVVKPMMSVTMSCDHRVIDGAEAAAFVKEFKGILETAPLSGK